MSQPNTVVLVAPQGCGKSTYAAALQQKFGCAGIVEEWHFGKKITSGHLHLTHVADVAERPAGVMVIQCDSRDDIEMVLGSDDVTEMCCALNRYTAAAEAARASA